MIVVSDASPLISLSKAGLQGVLPALFGNVLITPEVAAEVGVPGRPGALVITSSPWITVVAVAYVPAVPGLGAGEASAIELAHQRGGGLFLADDRNARRAARAKGLDVMGCIGVLESAYRGEILRDLGAAYRSLLDAGSYAGRALIDNSLRHLALPPL